MFFFLRLVTVDELLNGFRVQQLQLSTTMMNASYYSRLPEKLAAAEAREADERGAKGTNYQCLGMFLITPSSLKIDIVYNNDTKS